MRHCTRPARERHPALSPGAGAEVLGEGEAPGLASWPGWGRLFGSWAEWPGPKPLH